MWAESFGGSVRRPRTKELDDSGSGRGWRSRSTNGCDGGSRWRLVAEIDDAMAVRLYRNCESLTPPKKKFCTSKLDTR
jgi:hypothetical protein